jgi:predicted enzyme related to lactoylglutathione lyase
MRAADAVGSFIISGRGSSANASRVRHGLNRDPSERSVVVRIRHQVVVFDAADLAPESSFWAGVLGGRVDAEDDWHMVFVDDEPRVGVQLAPDHVSPEWPDGTPQQIHLDLWVDDIGAAHDQVMSLGAKLLKPAEAGPPETPDNYQVYADPAGHPFCLCWINR